MSFTYTQKINVQLLISYGNSGHTLASLCASKFPNNAKHGAALRVTWARIRKCRHNQITIAYQWSKSNTVC